MTSRKIKKFKVLVGIGTTLALMGCGSGFDAHDANMNALLNGLAPDGSNPPTDSPEPSAPINSPSALNTMSKAIGTATTAKVITWNLSTEVTKGQTFAGASLMATVQKITPTDGSPDVYYISKVTLKTGAQAIIVKAAHVWLNGFEYESGTTFSGIDRTVPANTTLQISNGTLVYQLSGPAQPTDTIAFEFYTLWPEDVPLPGGGGSGPVKDGPTLYLENCAGCHSPLATSEKRGATFNDIKQSMQDVSTMRFLDGKFTDQEIQLMADALK